ncbi:MAG: chromosome partitioning protein ParB [Deltaproteobacteria bacterium HGW-Deltaproteobacteria-17]|nr:MAG: chromosome partitioning protein ParB [Deltaproteobacteria bacterium HGW-Deltaproteobacteria-17]
MTKKAPPKKALGRGLSALIPEKKAAAAPPPPPVIPDEQEIHAAQASESLLWVNINIVHPSEVQPRTAIDEVRLEELTESIREKGLLSPLIVRSDDAGGYVIIAGERRWRACRRAGLTRIPVLLKETDELEAFELALVENIQREDLSPLEEAESYRHLITSRNYQHDEVAQRVGKNRSTVTNALRLLRLPTDIKGLLGEKRISVGHAVALLGLDDEAEMLDAATQVVQKGLSVRATEKLVQLKKARKEPKKRPAPPASLVELQDNLQTQLGTRVKIKARSSEKGSITIDYYTLDQFEALYKFLTREAKR